MQKVWIAGVGFAVLAASAAIAQPAPYSQQQPMMRDGVQTRGEVVQRVRDRFARMDLNRDGFVTREEGQQAAGQMRGQRTERRAQRGADPARRAQRDARAFERFDLNRNGVITREEFAQVRAQRGDGGQRMGMQRGERRGMAMRMRGAMGARMFVMADANRDNRVSIQEATEAALRRFDMADLNRDGQVTREERQQARQRMMQNRGMRG